MFFVFTRRHIITLKISRLCQLQWVMETEKHSVVTVILFQFVGDDAFFFYFWHSNRTVFYNTYYLLIQSS